SRSPSGRDQTDYVEVIQSLRSRRRPVPRIDHIGPINPVGAGLGPGRRTPGAARAGVRGSRAVAPDGVPVDELREGTRRSACSGVRVAQFVDLSIATIDGRNEQLRA